MSEQVRQMFATIAPRYDVINTVLSLGTHKRWKKLAVRTTQAKPGDRVLDCATGTGDLAFMLAKRVGITGHVDAVDFCAPMLTAAQDKTPAQIKSQIHFQVADVLNLPFANATFVATTISFGIRNVDDPKRGLQEMARVVKPGGRVVVLEFGQPKASGFASLYRWYSKTIMPKIGGWLSGNPDAYKYLPETAAAFPAGDAFVQLMQQTGSFSSITQHELTGGIAYIYCGIVR